MLLKKATQPMFTRSRLSAFALAATAALALAGAADAGWVTIKNDTKTTVTVQEFAIVNGKKVTGKPTKLQPGESFREFQNTAGIKNYDILASPNAAQPLWSDMLNCKGDSQTFSIAPGAQGRLTVTPVPEPKKQ